MVQIGFIGAGNMASAIIEGVISAGLVAPDQIGAYDPGTEQLAKFAQRTGIRALPNNTEVIVESDWVVLAVKPQVLAAVLEPLKAQLVQKRPLVISIAAGVTLAHLDRWISPEVPMARVMPNLNVAAKQGMAAVTGNQAATSEQVEAVAELFRTVGQAIVLEERLFPAFTAIAGSSPAWVFLLIDALARGALAAGMPKQQARAVATQAVLGSAALLQLKQEHPWELIDQVSSPGGTTQAGLNVLEDRGFSSAVVAAVAATIQRDSELGT
ncbi:MAG: pyrroline-5-carboxylate reductase [Bifidobacteriaceae bacterium]|jgi:pyrroline-5-carboxylate reductase|nr:pyrroline-5-carboxylate reductase [Bifidobacteriaceae bacterium]